MRLLIIDDEAVFQQKIKERLTAFFAAENVAAEIDVCGDPAAVKEKGLYRQYDVMLLDIEMPALSGLDLAAYINGQRGGTDKPYIIFVTNRDELVFDALKLQPFSFVRKGHLEDAEPCLRRILERLRREDFIVIHTGRGTQRLRLNEILASARRSTKQSARWRERAFCGRTSAIWSTRGTSTACKRKRLS